MAIAVVMPALEMAQETGVLVRWLKKAGEQVGKGEPIMEVETDKATVEVESPGEGVLGGVVAAEGDVVPVGNTIAWILAPGEEPPKDVPAEARSGRTRRREHSGSMQDTAGPARSGSGAASASTAPDRPDAPTRGNSRPGGNGRSGAAESGESVPLAWAVTPLARNIAEENGVDLSRITPKGNRIEKADVLAYMGVASSTGILSASSGAGGSRVEAALSQRRGDPAARLLPASPKARRLAAERRIELATLIGSGPEGAVLAGDVLAGAERLDRGPGRTAGSRSERIEEPSSVWRVMAARMSESWSGVPHFYLMREVEAGRLLEWRARAAEEVAELAGVKLTLTDLLVKCAGWTLRRHPQVNASWLGDAIKTGGAVNVGIATALDEGLVVPVIADADSASLAAIAERRSELIAHARDRRLRPEEMANGSFTITNLGMYNVDAFNAIVNPPQAAILAVGRIAERVVPVEGKAEIRPMMVMTLSCDHRAVDGARAAQFLDDLARTIEDPWRMLI